MNRDIELAPADPRDAPAIVRVFSEARSGMTYLPVVHTAEEIMEHFTNLVHLGHCWVAKDQESIVGFMEVRTGWLNHLYVAPESQKMGIGKALLDQAKVIAQTALQLWMFEDNKGAIRFYEREGFVLEEQRDMHTAVNEENLPDRRYGWHPR